MFDLTPFGFTPTEGIVYARLLDLGPSSGYAVGKALAIARANAYQALDGLVTKGGAVVSTDDPKTYRAVTPSALFALIAQQQAQQLDQLEQALDALGRGSDAGTQPFQGERELHALILRSATRALGTVRFVAPAAVAAAAAPVWRKRRADRQRTELWIVGDASGVADAAGTVLPERVPDVFGDGPVILIADEVVIVGRIEDGTPRGYWSTDPIIHGMAGAAIRDLVGS